MALRVLHQLRSAVETQRLAVEHGSQKAGGLMLLEPTAHVHQQRKTGGMAFGKTVFTKALDLFEDVVGKALRVAACQHAADHTLIELVHATLALPGCHGAAQAVSLTGAEARRQHRNLHHLLLKNRHTQRALQGFAQDIARVVDRLNPGAPTQVGVHHAALDRTRAHDRDLDHQIVKAAGFEARQHAHLGPTLNLEHAHGIGPTNHVVGGDVLGRNVLHQHRSATARTDQIEAAADGAEHAQCEHVNLEQAHGVQIVLVPLDDRALWHGRVLHRHQARELALCQHKAAHMLA